MYDSGKKKLTLSFKENEGARWPVFVRGCRRSGGSG